MRARLCSFVCVLEQRPVQVFPHLPHRERLQTTGYRFRISVGQCQSVEMFFSFSYLTLICLLIKLNLLMFSRVYFDDLSYQIKVLARMRH